MKQYIDKDALLAEIENIKSIEFNEKASYDRHACMALDMVKEAIETLEVKEVDLDKEYKNFVEEDPVYNKLVNGVVGKAIAKHFFELGIEVSNKAQKGEEI